MGVTISVGLIVILIAVIVMSRRGRKTTASRPSAQRRGPTKPSSKFHAVSLYLGENACEAARNMEGRRFLATGAPRIPLPGCNTAECKCRFIHHADRRSGIERRGQYVPSGIADTPGYAGRERRYRGDRRDSEAQSFFT